jgi:hypothetical protein
VIVSMVDSTVKNKTNKTENGPPGPFPF